MPSRRSEASLAEQDSLSSRSEPSHRARPAGLSRPRHLATVTSIDQRAVSIAPVSPSRSATIQRRKRRAEPRAAASGASVGVAAAHKRSATCNVRQGATARRLLLSPATGAFEWVGSRRTAQRKSQKYLVISEEPAHCRVSARRRRENFASKQPDYVEIRDFSGAT